MTGYAGIFIASRVECRSHFEYQLHSQRRHQFEPSATIGSLRLSRQTMRPEQEETQPTADEDFAARIAKEILDAHRRAAAAAMTTKTKTMGSGVVLKFAAEPLDPPAAVAAKTRKRPKCGLHLDDYQMLIEQEDVAAESSRCRVEERVDRAVAPQHSRAATTTESNTNTSTVPAAAEQAVVKACLPSSMRFTDRLMAAMNDEKFSNFLIWNEAGDEIHIASVRNFCILVLPVYFDRSSYGPFVKELWRWSFVKRPIVVVPHGPIRRVEAIFAHKYFRRDNPGLINLMTWTNNPTTTTIRRSGQQQYAATIHKFVASSSAATTTTRIPKDDDATGNTSSSSTTGKAAAADLQLQQGRQEPTDYRALPREDDKDHHDHPEHPNEVSDDQMVPPVNEDGSSTTSDQQMPPLPKKDLQKQRQHDEEHRRRRQPSPQHRNKNSTKNRRDATGNTSSSSTGKAATADLQMQQKPRQPTGHRALPREDDQDHHDHPEHPNDVSDDQMVQPVNEDGNSTTSDQQMWPLPKKNLQKQRQLDEKRRRRPRPPSPQLRNKTLKKNRYQQQKEERHRNEQSRTQHYEDWQKSQHEEKKKQDEELRRQQQQQQVPRSHPLSKDFRSMDCVFRAAPLERAEPTHGAKEEEMRLQQQQKEERHRYEQGRKQHYKDWQKSQHEEKKKQEEELRRQQQQQQVPRSHPPSEDFRSIDCVFRAAQLEWAEPTHAAKEEEVRLQQQQEEERHRNEQSRKQHYEDWQKSQHEEKKKQDEELRRQQQQQQAPQSHPPSKDFRSIDCVFRAAQLERPEPTHAANNNRLANPTYDGFSIERPVTLYPSHHQHHQSTATNSPTRRPAETVDEPLQSPPNRMSGRNIAAHHRSPEPGSKSPELDCIANAHHLVMNKRQEVSGASPCVVPRTAAVCPPSPITTHKVGRLAPSLVSPPANAVPAVAPTNPVYDMTHARNHPTAPRTMHAPNNDHQAPAPTAGYVNMSPPPLYYGTQHQQQQKPAHMVHGSPTPSPAMNPVSTHHYYPMMTPAAPHPPPPPLYPTTTAPAAASTAFHAHVARPHASQVQQPPAPEPFYGTGTAAAATPTTAVAIALASSAQPATHGDGGVETTNTLGAEINAAIEKEVARRLDAIMSVAANLEIMKEQAKATAHHRMAAAAAAQQHEFVPPSHHDYGNNAPATPHHYSIPGAMSVSPDVQDEANETAGHRRYS